MKLNFSFKAATFAIGAALPLASVPLALNDAHAQSVFQKIGDGWRHGKWIPGLPDVKPKTWQEVVFPICWGSPQDCRGESEAKARPSHPPLFSATFRVDCIDAHNGRDRGDSSITYTSSKSIDDAKKLALDAYNTSDLCQIDPNYQDPSRIMKQGSGRFID